MNWMDFCIRLLTALMLGGVVGLERQWRQRMTGLRTNALVAVGSAMFVMMGGLISGGLNTAATCRASDESRVRALLLHNVGRTPLVLIALQSRDDEALAGVNVQAYLKTIGPKEEYLEQIVTRLSLEADVTTISWEVISPVDIEDAAPTTREELVGV